MTKTAVVIGSGFGGLGAACLLARDGYEVTVYEKNEQPGGRASLLETEEFRFDMGPSWYLMPEVFEQFFAALGENLHDHISLTRLSPSYRVFYKDLDEQLDIFSDLTRDRETFERIEPGAGAQLERYLQHAEHVYQTATNQFLYKNYDHVGGLLSPSTLKAGLRMHPFTSLDGYVQRYFKDPRLQKLMEYSMVFLGTSPFEAPALYSLMSHVDFTQGVFYPQGGMYELTRALVRIAEKHGVRIMTRRPVERIMVEDGRAVGVVVGGEEHRADIIVSNTDPAYTEQALLPAFARDHSERYWQSRVLAPSALLLYLGVNRQYDALVHHNLLFSMDWKRNFSQIFKDRSHFPDDPSLYVCAPSKTDPTVAPAGHENLFVLVPIAAGLEYTNAQLALFTDQILVTLEQEMGLSDLRRHLVYKKVFCVRDFSERFHSLQGTGLGLAHTLMQTAVLRPHNYSKKARGLYYVGANVHPGIGLPTSLISAELLLKRLHNDHSSLPFSGV